ncbi:unnamed protein product [Mytilus coruscus]|uniref:C1q domain-containing protein n=1 Tax=Mytilus coruscus TaxID=42192 RepID=A0A6J8CMX9_MYTCO|nr:unnamed protein product [Mytilus coruscus]
MYNEIAENYTKLQEAMATQDKNTANLQQDLLRIQTKCDAEINVAVNKTLALELKITQLEQLQNIKELQTLQTLQGQQNLDKKLQKGKVYYNWKGRIGEEVVDTGCTTGSRSIPAGPLKFPDIKTSVGVSNLSSFQSTGKFTCIVPGYYHIVTTILSADTHARIDKKLMYYIVYTDKQDSELLSEKMSCSFILLLMCGMSSGFLLDSKNSSFVSKPTYLTVAEYYGDKNQIHRDLEKLHQEQETFHQQQESYRDQQEKILNLLTNQIQQKFDHMEKMLAAQTSNKDTVIIEALVKKNQELENEYNTVQGKLTAKEQMCNEIAENYTKLQEVMATLDKNTANLQQDLLRIQTKYDAEINFVVNKTLALGLKITQLEQLQSIEKINQMQTLQTLQRQVQTFDSRINLLTSHEKTRNQDFLALYNLTTSLRHELENKMNKQFQTIEKNQNISVAMLQQKQHQNFQILHNLTSESMNENEKLENHTVKEINKIANHTINEIEQMGRYYNSSFSLFQQNLDEQSKKVVVTGCYAGGSNVPAGPLKFPVIKTSIGVSDLSSFKSTGKFTCQIPGYYHIVTTIMSDAVQLRIDIMKNSNSIHWQYMTGIPQNAWTPGSAAVALELKTNDNVWIKLYSTKSIYQSCLTIFKIN